MSKEEKDKDEVREQSGEQLNAASAVQGHEAQQDAQPDAAQQGEAPADDRDKQLDEAHQKIEELTDKLLRLHAEFDNYKKRNMKEKAELIRNAGERVLGDFLPLADDMERAIDSMHKAEDVAAVVEGINLIHDKLMQVFTKNGVSPIDTADAAFDTDFHEAVAMVPAESDDKRGKVVDCIQTGYKLNDKVLRHAKVVVAQ